MILFFIIYFIINIVLTIVSFNDFKNFSSKPLSLSVKWFFLLIVFIFGIPLLILGKIIKMTKENNREFQKIKTILQKKNKKKK